MDEIDDVAIESSEENIVQTVDPEIEKEARLFGWVPKEDFRGNEDDWRDADAFVKKGREINGFLRKDRERLMQELNKRDAKIAEIEAATKKFSEFHAQTEERAYKRAIEDLKAAKKEAREIGDVDKEIEIEDQIADLKEERKAVETKVTPTPVTPVLDPVFVAWNEDNKWFGTDRGLTAAANGIGETIRLTHPHLVGRDFLDEVVRQTKEEFPEKFESKRARSNMVEGGTTGARVSAGGKSYADLPKEAKEACDSFVNKKWMTREQYVKEYFGS